MGNFNGSTREVKAYRQLEVSRLRVKGLSIREIQSVMATDGQVNPQTTAPWSVGIIQRDCRELEKAWKSAAAADIAAAKGRQLAEIQEAKRTAWRLVDVNQVRQLIKLEMELLGTEAAKMVEVGGKGGGPLLVDHTHKLAEATDDDIKRTLAALGQSALAASGRTPIHDDPGDAEGDDSTGQEE